MFSIKHVHLDKSEEMHQSATARFTPSNRDVSHAVAVSETPPTVWIDSGPLTGGTVFVMNECGKTVARYDLGPSHVPLISGIDPHLTQEDQFAFPRGMRGSYVATSGGAIRAPG
jgi:hypothetical protein